MNDMQIAALSSGSTISNALYSGSSTIMSEIHTREVGIDPKLLRGRVSLNCENVYAQLRINEMDAHRGLVERCGTSLRSEPALISTFNTLKNLAHWAETRCPHDEDGEMGGISGSLYYEDEDSSQCEGVACEMLVDVFNYIAKFESGEGGAPHRLFTCLSPKTLDIELPPYGPSNRPSVVLTPANTSFTAPTWHDCDALGELKCANRKNPYEESITEIILHAADSARLHMACRPFMLFSVCLLVCGTRMCVGIVDRQSASFSPDFDMLEKPEELVLIIRSLTHDLALHDLGFDPTVQKMDETQTLRLGLTEKPSYPTHIISHIDPSGPRVRRWCTTGPPLWVSAELLGHGPYIFRVREYFEDGEGGNEAYLDTKSMLLKSYWYDRSMGAEETSLYTRLQDTYPDGLARILYGGEVVVPGTAIPITMGTSNSNFSLVLGRVIFKEVGRPLWEYQNEEELLRGLKSAVTAHQELCSRGIIHRDINPASIFLFENDNHPPDLLGFLLDLGHACLKKPTTENAKFSALEILEAISISPATPRFTHTTPTHDIQSFIWTTSYTLLRLAQTKLQHLLMVETTDENPRNDIETDYDCIHSIFTSAYSTTDYKQIVTWRTYRSPALACFFKNSRAYSILRSRGLISETMSQFMKSLSKLVEDDFYSDVPATPTHEQLLESLDIAIARFSAV
ncbi:hypothetical protein D9613_004751 [Agrocybe pediades]|uniref:Protein kinase domain-containing protein n=1 Tax=Agrocybe pediades TaxID=84607 RepID=A0A8H4VR71_9AGAR|nr:hypothetical protein D9613_004751 [Agrocybe pediades]